MPGYLLGLVELNGLQSCRPIPPPWQYSTLLQNEISFVGQRLRLVDVLRR